MDIKKKKKKTNVSLAKDEDGTDIKVKRHNLIVARASFPENTVLRGHTPEEIYDDGCKSQEIQSEIPGTVQENECVRENGRNNMYMYFKRELRHY